MSKITIYVPSRDRKGYSLDPSIVNSSLRDAGKMLSEMFGGATAIESRGFYKNAEGVLIEEQIIQIYSFTSVLTAEQEGAVIVFCENMKTALKQESTAYQVDEDFRLVA